MATDMLLGIDLGTTVLKVCAFDARSGATLGQAARRLAVHKTPDGGREQRPGAVDRAFSSAAAELRGLLGARWGRVAGIGLAAQGGSSIIADRRSGKASTPMILWNDGRTRGHSSRLAGGIPTAFWRERVLRDFAPTGLGRLLWLKEERPELFRHDTIHAGAGEYLFFKMTGVWRQDAGNAIQIGSFNAATKRLDPALFDLVGVPLSFVAPLRQGHETAPLCAKAARSLELPTGIPVAGPYIDQEAGYLSACAAAGRPLQCSLGTAWVGNYAVADDAVGASPYQLVLPNPAGEGRLVIEPMLCGNTSWDWGLETLMDPNHDKALAKAGRVFAQSLHAPPGLVAVPLLTQRNPLRPEAYGGGLFVGVSAMTTRADMLRALAAGMAFEFARTFEPIRERGAIDRLVLGGGASRGAQFRALFAALFSPLPVHWQIDSDLAAARGAVFAFSRRAARAETERAPCPKARDRAAIQEAYAFYKRVARRLAGGAQGDESAVV